MSEVKPIIEQLDRAFSGEAWHGPAVAEVLDGVGGRLAAARPISNAHSIWEIVLHMTATQDLVSRRLRGEEARLTQEEDWPPQGETGDEAWHTARADLDRSFREVRELIADVDDARLQRPIVPGFSSVYVTLHGLVQHNLYHAGQIAILKKAR